MEPAVHLENDARATPGKSPIHLNNYTTHLVYLLYNAIQAKGLSHSRDGKVGQCLKWRANNLNGHALTYIIYSCPVQFCFDILNSWKHKSVWQSSAVFIKVLHSWHRNINQPYEWQKKGEWQTITRLKLNWEIHGKKEICVFKTSFYKFYGKIKFQTKCIIWKNSWNYQYEPFTHLTLLLR